MKISTIFACLLGVSSFAVAATSAQPHMVQLFSVCSQKGVYMPRSDYEKYVERGGAVSGCKQRRLFCQYGVVSEPAETIRRVQEKTDAEGETFMLRDGNMFVIPRGACVMASIPSHEKPLNITARRLRPLVHLVLGVHDRMQDDKECDPVACAHELIAQQRYSRTDIRDIEDAFYALVGGDGWLKTLIVELAGDSDDGSDASSFDTCEEGATLFSGGMTQNSDGSFVRRNTIANVIRENHELGSGMPVVQGALDLAGKGITSIDDIGLLAQSLPSSVVREVTTIDLSHNDITHVSGYAFVEFPFLRVINLSYNACLTTIDKDAFSGLAHLQVLDISHADCAELPEGLIMHCEQLHTIRYNNNHLKVLPKLPQKNNLRTLAAQCNELTDMPDMSRAYKLSCLNLAYNKLTVAHAHFLPLPEEERTPALVAALFDHNQIEKIGSGFLARLPKKGIVDISSNPVWHDAHVASTEELLQASGYEHLSDRANRQGNLIANQIRDALFTDVREKLFDYLVAQNLVKAEVLKSEIVARRALASISTTAADVGMWFYRYGGWIVLGATLIGGGVGGLVGLAIKKVAVRAAVRFGVGAAIGAAAGAGLGYLGYSVYSDSENFYLNSGGSSVYMTSELRRCYIGTYRLMVLLAVLKQYLVAANTCLYWVLNYDELALSSEEGLVDTIMGHLEQQLHFRVKQVLARANEATCIATVTHLVSENPLDEVRRHSPEDLFPADTMDNQPIARDADYPWMGVEKATLVRTALCRFASVARVLRAYLMNRYLGHMDHVALLKVVGTLDELRVCLSGVIDDVLAPTVRAMGEVGHLHDEWGKEMEHLKAVAAQTRQFLQHLDTEAENVVSLARSSGVHRAD